MAYVQFSTLCMPVLHVHQCSKNFGFLIYNQKQARYQPVTYCTYWTVLGSYNNSNFIHLRPKSTHFDAFDEIHQVILDRIGDHMASLVQSVKHGSTNTADTTTNLFYVINFISKAYTLQNNTTIDRQIISAGELVSKAQYLCSIQENTNCYWKNSLCNRLS